MGRAFQPVDALNVQGRRARALNLGAHADQTLNHIDDFRLLGGVQDHRLALRQHGGQKGVLGRANADEGELDPRAGQTAGRLGVDIALVQIDVRAQRFERLQVQIHGTSADGAAAGQADLGMAGPCNERPQHVERGPHLADEIIAREGRDDFRRVQEGFRAVRPVGFGDFGSQSPQQPRQEPRVGEPWHIGQPERLVRQQAGGHQLDGGILGAADRDRSVERCAADNGDAVHRDS